MNIWTGVYDCLIFWVCLGNVDTHPLDFLATPSLTLSLAHSFTQSVEECSASCVVIYHSDLPSSLPVLLRDGEHVIWSQQAISQRRNALRSRLSSAPVALPFRCATCWFISPICRSLNLDRPSRIRGRLLYNLNILILHHGSQLYKYMMSCVSDRCCTFIKQAGNVSFHPLV